MEIEEVFGAKPLSVFAFLCENGQGLYVPAYQRQYSWDNSKIERLVEDICHGFTMLINHEDSITFLGTIIAIHDNLKLTVNPLVKTDVFSRVMLIIDGQQRLTTLLLINTLLHDAIRTQAFSIKNSQESEEVWLYEECMKVIGLLAKTFEEDMGYGDGPFQYYPRMIRTYDDSWSRKRGKAQYNSPIGRYLHLYSQHFRMPINADKLFDFKLPAKVADDPKHLKLSQARTVIKEFLKDLASNEVLDSNLPSFEDIFRSDHFQETLVKAEIPEDVRNTINLGSNNSYKELLRLVLFANFVLTRVALTVVTAKNEDYAFDMFEALNTTGEPLTAFETFKPRVIYFEGLGTYESSDSFKYMKVTEDYLEGIIKTEDKQKVTCQLIVTFALAERGEKLSKRLNEQRRFFKECFEKFEVETKRKYVQHLSHCASFVQHSWPENRSNTPSILSVNEAETDEVILCLDVMRKINHSIILGPLVRFYSEVLLANVKGRIKAINELILAVKAIAAFSILWRASRSGTNGIDTHYRNLMRQGCAAVNMPPLCRISSDGTGHAVPDAKLLKSALCHILKTEGKIESKNDWVKSTGRLPSYTNQKIITRLLLLAAAHDSAIDTTEPGLTVAGRENLLPMLNLKNWCGDSEQTIEHIAPSSRDGGWDENLYEDSNTINRLGNLTLLPLSENSSISNAPWDKKRIVYKILSAETNAELSPLLDLARGQGINISTSTEVLLTNSKYLPMVKAVASVTGDWTLDLVEKRSFRIAELAWERIAPWLGLTN